MEAAVAAYRASRLAIGAGSRFLRLIVEKPTSCALFRSRIRHMTESAPDEIMR